MSVPNLSYTERYIKQVAPTAAHWVILFFFFSCPTIMRADACLEGGRRECNDTWSLLVKINGSVVLKRTSTYNYNSCLPTKNTYKITLRLFKLSTPVNSGKKSWKQAKNGLKWVRKIWTKDQIEVKVRNSSKALSSTLVLSLIKKCYRRDAPKWNICFTPNSCQEKVYVDDYSKRRTCKANLKNY